MSYHVMNNRWTVEAQKAENRRSIMAQIDEETSNPGAVVAYAVLLIVFVLGVVVGRVI